MQWSTNLDGNWIKNRVLQEVKWINGLILEDYGLNSSLNRDIFRRVLNIATARILGRDYFFQEVEDCPISWLLYDTGFSRSIQNRFLQCACLQTV